MLIFSSRKITNVFEKLYNSLKLTHDVGFYQNDRKTNVGTCYNYK